MVENCEEGYDAVLVRYIAAPFNEEQLGNIRAYLEAGLYAIPCPNHAGRDLWEVTPSGIVCSLCGFTELDIVETITTGVALERWREYEQVLSNASIK